MADFFRKIKINHSLSAVVCVLIGLVLLIWPGMTTQIVCRLLGVVLLGFGLLQIVMYLSEQSRTLFSQGMLLFGIVLAVLGLWILIKPEMVIVLIPTIVGILIVLHGIHNVIQAVDLRQSGYEMWWLACTFGVLTTVLGLILVANPFTVVDTVVRLIGIFLIYDGLSDLWILSRVFQVKKRKDSIIDTEGKIL